MQKNVNDYIPQLLKLFPYLKVDDIKRIINYGWRMFYFYNLRGCDTVIKSDKYKYWMYCGNLYENSITYFNYYKKMLQRKIRVLYIKNHINWDGYYYTAISEEEFEQFKSKKGRKRKNFHFKNKISFKIFNEAKLYFNSSKYIIKFKYVDMGYSFKKDILKCQNAEIELIREHPDTFKDILITNYNYKL